MAAPDVDLPDAPQAPPYPARARVPSARPALVVVGIAAVIVVLFGVGSALSGSSGPSPAHRQRVQGLALGAQPAARVLRPIELPGTPPADVLSSIVVPAGARTLSSTPWDRLTQFSGSMRFSVPASQAAVVSFYRAELRARGWAITSVGPAHNAPSTTEVLAQRTSSDGWYWDIGLLVAPTTFGSGSQAASDTTRFTLELYEVTDST